MKSDNVISAIYQKYKFTSGSHLTEKDPWRCISHFTVNFASSLCIRKKFS